MESSGRVGYLERLAWRRICDFPAESEDFSDQDVFDVAFCLVEQVDAVTKDIPLPVMDCLLGLPC